MLSVIAIWLYIIFTTLSSGAIVMRLLRKLKILSPGYEPRGFLGYILAGLVFVTVYAQIFSLFGGVGVLANIILVIISLTAIFTDFQMAERMYSRLMLIFMGGNETRLAIKEALIFSFIFLLMAYGASHGIMHYDTGLYHAQAIRWIEEYGVVRGIANLHTRLGYNSSAFALNALYSFHFTGRSFHVTSGFCALLLAWESVRLFFEDRFFKPSNMARIAGIYYLLMIYDEMVSPASDYYLVTLAFILIIRWLDGDEEEEYLLSFFSCYLFTIKLSGALLMLISLYPAYKMLKNRDIKKLLLSLFIGFIVIAPYLYRNILISGWLLYPSTAFPVFDVSWRVPAGIAEYDKREITVYGRGYTDVSRYSEGAFKWLPEWFMSLSFTDRVICVAAMVAVAYFVIYCLFRIIKRIKGSEVLFLNPSDEVCILTICISLMFWIFTSPLMRYGCLYLYLACALIWGREICRIADKNKAFHRLFIYALIVLGAYKALMWGIETVRVYDPDTWIAQKDYEYFDTYSYEIKDAGDRVSLTFYAPVNGDRAGYDPFPSTPYDMSDSVGMRGSNIKAGFFTK